MSARSPRRQFASPFVVTMALAAAVPIATSQGYPKASAPAAPEPASDADAAARLGHAGRLAQPKHRNPPPPGAVTPPAVKPSKDVAPDSEPTRWKVQLSNDHCTARRIVEHRECAPGSRCNPPKPFNYDCAPGFVPPFEIIQSKGSTRCFVNADPSACPPGEKCNPPKPRRIRCPES